MKIVEFQQSAYGGGFPAPNGDGFEHGERVYIVSANDLDEMLDRISKVRRLVDELDESTK